MIVVLGCLAGLVALVAVLALLAPPRWVPAPITAWPEQRQAANLGLDSIVLPDHAAVDWDARRADLDAAHVNVLSLAAGRVEWTAFDWPAHPEAAARPGHDYLAELLAELGTMPDGRPRFVSLTIDALIPNWIRQDASVAGRREDGTLSTYTPSASAIHDGAVGRRFVDYAVELATRYEPMQVGFSELHFDDETFGDDDLALFRQMTGAADWPRNPSGGIDQDSPAIGQWRSEVLAAFLGRVRAALDEVTEQVGHRVELGTDVRVNWDDPAAGRPDSGQDYRKLAAVADRLELWAYFGTAGQAPADVGWLTAALSPVLAPQDYTISVGLWAGDVADQAVAPPELAKAVAAAGSAGSRSTAVTPMSLMSDGHWQELAGVWTTWPA